MDSRNSSMLTGGSENLDRHRVAEASTVQLNARDEFNRLRGE
jgi:hypothetical protein